MNRDEVQELAEAALTELALQLEKGKSETLVQYLQMLARFHQYSFGNCILIASQRPDATHVAGFHRWKQLGRQVKKGERGIAILAPLIRRRKSESVDEDRGGDNRRGNAVFGFRVVHVFDVRQTEGRELTQFAAISGEPGDKLGKLEAAIRERGIGVEYADYLHGALGVSEGGRIQVLAELAAAEKFSVLAHEFGHELLHRGERRNETTKTIRETEAEAVAFVVCQACGLDCSTRSSDYIQLYAGDALLLQESLDHVQRVSSTILTAIESVPSCN